MKLIEALDVLKFNGLDGSDFSAVCQTLLDNDDFDNESDRKIVALCLHLNTTDIVPASYDGEKYFDADGGTYMVLTEDEKEEAWEDSLEYYLDECVPGSDGPYFDREAWKRDTRIDGAGHSLSSYDGNEEEVSEFFIYRTN